MQNNESSIVFEWWYNEQEYRISKKHHLKRVKQAYEDAEREDKEDEYII